jgi:hypothetical protein
MTVAGLRPSGRPGLSPRRRRSSFRSFSPDQLAELAVWYGAGDPHNTVASGAVERAFDLSGNGRHGTATDSSARPLDTTDPDGRAIMSFDGFTLTGSLVDQWNDRSGKSLHWTASASARPDKATHAGNNVVRLDGVDDVLSMTGTLPVIQPFTVAVICGVRNRVDFKGVLSAAAATGLDHTSFWTFETATAASNNLQLFGSSVESGGQQMSLTRAHAA